MVDDLFQGGEMLHFRSLYMEGVQELRDTLNTYR